MLSEGGTHSHSHRLNVNLLKAQAEAMEVPIVTRQAEWGTYEEEFNKVITDFREDGIEAGVFGDIGMPGHRDWVERTCRKKGLKAILPLWERAGESLLDEFIACGFKAIIATVKLECMGIEWLGREINEQFMRDIKQLPQIDPCGENGEYHTFVYDGPIFKNPIGFIRERKLLKDKHSFLILDTKPTLSCEGSGSGK